MGLKIENFTDDEVGSNRGALGIDAVAGLPLFVG
jgi:hypothetical protein